MIFMYDLDFGRYGLSIKSESTFWMLLRYFSIVDKLRLFAGLLVVMSGMVHTGVEVRRIDSEMSGLVE